MHLINYLIATNGFGTKHTQLVFCRLDVVTFSKGNNKTVHPTQKPVDLLKYLIKTYTNEGMTVLDNVMGSGSTGVAAKQLKRNFIGMELDDKYFGIAKQRISKV